MSNNDYLLDQNTTSRVLLAYSFSEDGYAEDTKNVSLRSLGLNDSSDNDVAMLVVDEVLIVTDGVVFVGVDAKNMSNSWPIVVSNEGIPNKDYYFTSLNNLLQFELCHVDGVKLWVKIILVWDS